MFSILPLLLLLRLGLLSGLTLDLVLTHFAEPSSSIAEVINLTVASLKVKYNVTWHVYIYCKNPHIIWQMPIGIPEDRITTVRVPNEGREGDSMLRYVISRYVSLPDFVLFTQAHPNVFEVWPDRLANFSDSVQVIALGNVGYCGCSGCYVESGGMLRIRELYAMATKHLCEYQYQAYFNGQMLVSRRAILHQPLSLYNLLFDMLHAPPNHFIHRDLCQRHRRSLTDAAMPDLCVKIREAIQVHEETNMNSLFGHVLERSWSFLFGCENASGPICFSRSSFRGRGSRSKKKLYQRVSSGGVLRLRKHIWKVGKLK
jgi:hypothetical protein